MKRLYRNEIAQSYGRNKTTLPVSKCFNWLHELYSSAFFCTVDKVAIKNPIWQNLSYIRDENPVRQKPYAPSVSSMTFIHA